MGTKLYTLLLLIASAMGDDGCRSSKNVEWLCGDKCLDSGAPCLCGNTTIHSWDYSWCCGEGCSGGGGRSGATCPHTATVIPLNQTCSGRCNSWPEDKTRNMVGVRSHVHITCSGVSTCVPEQLCKHYNTNWCVSRIPNLCPGDPFDCQTDNRTHTCNMQHMYGGHSAYQCHRGPCISVTDKLNGVYNCPGRDDEESDNDETVDNDYKSDTKHDSDENNHPTDDPAQTADLQACLFIDRYPGLMCGGKCQRMYYLCDPAAAAQLPTLAQECQEIAGGGVCTNQTFMSQYKQYSEDNTDWTVCGGILPGEMVPKCEYLGILLVVGL